MAMEETPSTTFNFPQGMGAWGQKYGMSGSALGLGIAGLVAGGLAILGVRLPGVAGNGGCCDLATQRDLGYERQLSEKGEEVASLKAQLYTDQQVNALRQEINAVTTAQQAVNAGTAAVVAQLQAQGAQYQSMMMQVIKPAYLAPSEAVLSAYKAAATPAAASTTPAADSGSNG